MGLSAFFSPSKQVTQGELKFYLAILLTDTTIQTGFWQIGTDSISILERSSLHHYSELQELLVETDLALQELGKASESVEEVILGLDFNWVHQTGILDEKKPLLKRLMQDLSLHPVGFVVTTEALYHFLLTQDPQVSTLLIDYAVQTLTVSMIHRGKLLSTERVGRSENAAADVQEAVARLFADDDQSTVPPRIHILSSILTEDELREQKQSLTSLDWKAVSSSFVHQPIIEILPTELILEAVVQEGGKAVAESQGHVITGSLEKRIEMGAVAEPEEIAVPPQPFMSDELVVPTPESLEATMPESFEVPEYAVEAKSATFMEQLRQKSQSFMEIFSKPKRRQSTTQPGIENQQRSLVMAVAGGIGAGAVALLIVGYISLLGMKRATVDMVLNAKTLVADVTITLDPSISVSQPEKMLLKATLIEDTYSEQKTATSTGIKVVGDAAKGKVTFSNKSNDPKTIAAGTQLQVGGVAFTLDKEVSVASASVSQSSQGETKTYGKADGEVSAVKIGADGNIAAQKVLSVGSLSDSVMTAESISAFSGGSSREVRIFSKEDNDKAVQELTKQVLAKATESYKKQSTAGEYILPTGAVIVVKQSAAAKVGDEVDDVQVTLEAKVPAVKYLASDIKSLVQTALAAQIPTGYVLSQKEPTILSQPAAQTAKKPTTLVLATNISAQALPSVDLAGFAREIAGQSPSSAEAILRSKAEVKSAVVTLTPSFATTISNWVPKNTKQIDIKIKN